MHRDGGEDELRLYASARGPHGVERVTEVGRHAYIRERRVHKAPAIVVRRVQLA